MLRPRDARRIRRFIKDWYAEGQITVDAVEVRPVVASPENIMVMDPQHARNITMSQLVDKVVPLFTAPSLEAAEPGPGYIDQDPK